MTYILAGTQAPKAPAVDPVLMAAGNTLLSAVGETIKQGIKNGLTRYQVYNLVRFSDAEIKDPKLTERMNKGDYTPPFKLYRDAVGLALKASRGFNARVPAKDINDAAFEGFKTLYNTVLDVQEPGKKTEDKKLETKSDTPDNTMLIAAVAILGIGAVALGRMKK